MRPEDFIVGRNTGRNEFSSHVRTLGKFGKLSDFVLVLDGDSREMEMELKAVAKKYGHALQPLFLPGYASLEQWLWEILRTRPDDYARTFGLAEADMKKMTDRVIDLVEGSVQQRDAAKAALGVFADYINRNVQDVARSVGRMEAETGAIPGFLQDLREQIERWRTF